MEELLNIVRRMEPKEALAELTKTLKTIFAVLDEDARIRFVLDLLEKTEADKVSSLVHL